MAYLWDTPSSLAALWLAFLVNLTAYPLTSGLLPYVAMDIYHVEQTGLGYLIASIAFGGLLGSVAIGLTAAGALIDRIGFVPTATLYCGVGLALTLLIALRWRAVLWPLAAQANAR